MGPISQLERNELDGATAVSGTMLTNLSCRVKILPAEAANPQREAPSARLEQGEGSSCCWGLVPHCRWVFHLCRRLDAKLPVRVLVAAHHQPGWCQMLPRCWCLCTCSQRPRGGCSGMLAHGHIRLRGGRCGEEWCQPVSFGSFLLNWDPVSTSPGSGRCSHVSWGFRAAVEAAGKLELQVSVAENLSVPAVVP